MSKHTPGPWLYTQEGKDAYGIVEPDGTSILHMQALSNSTGASHLEANARLIAAAPELLAALQVVVASQEALQAALGVSDWELSDASQWIQARAAIAKAAKAPKPATPIADAVRQAVSEGYSDEYWVLHLDEQRKGAHLRNSIHANTVLNDNTRMELCAKYGRTWQA